MKSRLYLVSRKESLKQNNMKHLRQSKKGISLTIVMALLLSCSSNGFSLPESNFKATNQNLAPLLTPPSIASNTIKIALLLDTSGSMNGLLEQAKSQLWKIVNQLSMAKKNDQNASLQIALYQYGNDRLNSQEGYIENVLPLSSDLDELSEKLFALTTNGGNEYCGHVIQTATNQLDWQSEAGGLNLIFIAGNEAFTQGEVDYKTSCKNALDNGITINTIFCGDYQNGISTSWLNGASVTEGTYMNIDMGQKTIYVETPYDQKIADLNVKLNETYIGYGELGIHKKNQQTVQDNNSKLYGNENMVTRTISKSNHLYSNTSWDLVDASKDKSFNIESVDSKTLPTEMQKMTIIQKQAYIKKQSEDRKMISDKINDLNAKRIEFIASSGEGAKTNSLDAAMIKAIKKQANAKGFSFTNNNTTEAIKYREANVDFSYFEKVTQAAKTHRSTRLINFNTFTTYSKDVNTIILDTRSKRMYDRMHIKGAIHINFSDFTQQYLKEMIPDTNTRILIYCNNNFYQEPLFLPAFVTKSVQIEPIEATDFKNLKTPNTLALNIPTYINLYGYHYRNVYELHELISSTHPNLEMEGTDVANFQKN
jgi:hypothetical protein